MQLGIWKIKNHSSFTVELHDMLKHIKFSMGNKMNNNKLHYLLLVMSLVSFYGCSEEVREELEVKEIIKPQLDALDKAKGVDGILRDAGQQRQQNVDEQTY